MLIEAKKGGGISGGGIENVPIKVESFRRPTLKFSYPGGVFEINGMFLVWESEFKNSSWSTIMTFSWCMKHNTCKSVDTTTRMESIHLRPSKRL